MVKRVRNIELNMILLKRNNFILKRFNYIFIFFLSNIFISFSQNLVTNPGFEDGFSGWNNLWTRTTNAGAADIANTNVHSGLKSLHIKHWGLQDWSLGVNKSYNTIPGSYVEYSAWVKVQKLSGWSELGVILYDSNKTVITWSYGSVRFDSAKSGYYKYTAKFIIPGNVKYFSPRFIGGEECELYIDDVELYQKSNSLENKSFILEDGSLMAEISVPSFSIKMTDKQNQITYKTDSTYNFLVKSYDSSKNSIIIHTLYPNDSLNLDFQFEIKNGGLKINLISDANAAFNGKIPFPGRIMSKNDDYILLPRATGLIFPAKEKSPFGDFYFYAWKSTMSFFGVTNLRTGYMIASEDPWNTKVEFTTAGDEKLTCPVLVHLPEKNKFSHNRTFYLVPVKNTGYIEMCKWYRNLVETLGYIKTFNQKIIENPNVNKLIGAVDFWALNKNFQSPDFIDTLYNYGFDKAIISLSGSWYTSGDLSKIIDSINSKNLLSSRYDIYTDVWQPTHPEWNWYRTEGFPDDIIIDKNNNLQTGWLSYAPGNIPFQGYVACSQTHTKYAEKWISAELQKLKYNCRFIDVELAAGLMECYSPMHPLGRRMDAYYRIQLLDKVKNRFNLVTGSEEARDFAFPVVDFGEGTMTMLPDSNAGYDWSTPVNPRGNYELYNTNPVYRVPLHGLVYHDVHVPTWYTGDGQSKVPALWDDKDLFNILYSSMPLFMPPDYKYWQANKEKFITSYHIISGVFRETGKEQMLSHSILSQNFKFQKTEYSNGWRVFTNFDNISYSVENKLIPSKGFYAGDGVSEIYRLNENGKTFVLVKLTDRLFINSYGNEISKYGMRVNGSALMQKNGNRIFLTFTGSQNYVDLNPGNLPWQIKNPRVFLRNKAIEISPEKLSEGWIRINKTGNNIFYYIDGEFISTGIRITQTEKPKLIVYPNPFNPDINIKFTIPQRSLVRIDIYNPIGQVVKNLVDKVHEQGNYNIRFKGSGLSSGLYFVKFNSDKQTIIQKILLLK
jgi:hypothetical protein